MTAPDYPFWPRPSASFRFGLLVLLTASGCGTEGPSPASEGGEGTDSVAPVDAFRDEAGSRGLSYVNRSGRATKPTILEANGAGVALLDLESDGDLDVVFAQGLAAPADLLRGEAADLELFLNDGEANFRRAPGPGLSGWWTGLASGDLDADGEADLVVGGYGDALVLLQRDGRLVAEAPETSGLWSGANALRRLPKVERGERPEGEYAIPFWTTGAALFDADRDGFLDLYLGRYLELHPENPPLGSLGEGALSLPCVWKGHQVFCGPRGLVPQPDAIFRGSGDGRFEERTRSWLPDASPAFTLGVAPFDADMDGDSDLYVANDSAPNHLWINELETSGGFRELGLSAGVALNPDGEAEAGMGIAVGDVNRDGRFDLAVTNFSDEPTQLYLGAGVGFSCATYRLGLANATRRLLSWGVHLEDFDGDGWLDLYTANGHVYPAADLPGTGTRYGQPDSLFHLFPSFETFALGEPNAFAPAVGTRGSAVGDLDGDGDGDLVLARIDGPAALGINSTGRDAQRLVIRCLGPERRVEEPGARTPRDALGTRVVVILEGGDTPFALLREVQTARGFQSASSPWLRFGLGAAAGYDAIRVLWPSGRVEELPAGSAGKRLTIREGQGIIQTEDLR